MNTTPESTSGIAERLQLCLPCLPLAENPNRRITDLGLDSMDTVELLCVIHEEFGVRLSDSDFHSTQTIGGLLSVIARKTTNCALP
jgi:acyl carrier protein